MATQKSIPDWINLVLGVLLFISPWLLGFADMELAAINAWIAGGIVIALAVSALVSFRQWEEWVNIVVGLWVAVAPWILGFTGLTGPRWGHLALGLLIALVAAWRLWASGMPDQMARA
jgi:heme/copper-type cytochrome/quinol oxidase subunit 3